MRKQATRVDRRAEGKPQVQRHIRATPDGAKTENRK